MYDGSVWGKMRLNFVTKSDFVYFGRTLRLYNMICNRSYFIPLLEFFSWLPIGCLLISIFSNRSENLKLWIQFRHWLLITNVWPPMLLHVWTPIRASYRSFWMCKSDYHAPPTPRFKRSKTVKVKNFTTPGWTETVNFDTDKLQQLTGFSSNPIRVQSNSF